MGSSPISSFLSVVQTPSAMVRGVLCRAEREWPGTETAVRPAGVRGSLKAFAAMSVGLLARQFRPR